jgi:hypothetical protein
VLAGRRRLRLDENLRTHNWESNPPERVILGPERRVTDTDITISTSAIQLADGWIATEDDDNETPHARIYGYDDLNSDQARELASALLEAAAELDGWVTR